MQRNIMAYERPREIIVKREPLKLVSDRKIIMCKPGIMSVTKRYKLWEAFSEGEELKYLIINRQEEAFVYNRYRTLIFRQSFAFNNNIYKNILKRLVKNTYNYNFSAEKYKSLQFTVLPWGPTVLYSVSGRKTENIWAGKIYGLRAYKKGDVYNTLYGNFISGAGEKELLCNTAETLLRVREQEIKHIPIIYNNSRLISVLRNMENIKELLTVNISGHTENIYRRREG